MGRGQGQGQLLFKLNKLTLREVFKNNSSGALEGWRLDQSISEHAQDCSLSLALGLQPQRVGSPSLADRPGHP